MPTEWEAFQKLTEPQHRWMQVWVRQTEALDRKATALITLDGLLLALTASFLGTSINSPTPSAFKVSFGLSTILILSSAAASVGELRVRRFLSEIIARAGGIEEAYSSLRRSRNSKARLLEISIGALLVALVGYALAILFLLL